ncbi:MAG TPA: hypothetical protein VK694_07600 [Verrucomicrobiae bacterium]|nr:hypothetical protein [Verrucomicrobiae bacterium]
MIRAEAGAPDAQRLPGEQSADDHDAIYAWADAAALQAAAGESPELGAQFTLVLDTGRPPDALVPATDYTGYFARREFPVASSDNQNHYHDKGHAALFKEMIEKAPALPDTLQDAAVNCGSDPEKCLTFAIPFDRIEDEFLFMKAEQPGNYKPGEKLHGSLVQLVKLSLGPGADDEEIAARTQELWQTLGFEVAQEQWDVAREAYRLAHQHEPKQPLTALPAFLLDVTVTSNPRRKEEADLISADTY